MGRRTKYERALLREYGITERGADVFLRVLRALIDTVRDVPIVANDGVGDVVERAAREVGHLRGVVALPAFYRPSTRAHAMRTLGIATPPARRTGKRREKRG